MASRLVQDKVSSVSMLKMWGNQGEITCTCDQGSALSAIYGSYQE
jgi:hypothetical protein